MEFVSTLVPNAVGDLVPAIAIVQNGAVSPPIDLAKIAARPAPKIQPLSRKHPDPEVIPPAPTPEHGPPPAPGL